MRQKTKETIERARTFFACNNKAINERNWKTLRYLCWVYFFTLLGYYAISVFLLRMSEQKLTLLIFLAVQLVFSVAVSVLRRVPRGRHTVSAFLGFFGACIMAMSILLGTVYSRESTATLFPIFLVMMSEFYILNPFSELGLILLPFGTFLVMSYLYKPFPVFVMDTVIACVSIGIAFIGYFVTMLYQMQLFEKQQELERMSSVDPLTGVPNRKAFLNAFHRLAGREECADYALAVTDIDHFKEINDRNGHTAGDAVLLDFCRLAERFFAVGEGSDVLLARFGGDEFLFLFRNVTDAETLRARAEAFCREVRESAAARQVPEYSCSMGIVVLGAGEQDFDRVFGAADQQLYRAKEKHGADVSLQVL